MKLTHTLKHIYIAFIKKEERTFAKDLQFFKEAFIRFYIQKAL